jgi:hypothetical protein
MSKERDNYLDWVNSLRKVEEIDQANWIYRTLKSKRYLHIFGRFFFPHIILADEIPDFQIQFNDFLAAPGHGAGIEPRGVGKTTWERIDSLHDICYHLEDIVVFYGNTATDAQFHLESIKAELESNARLISVYGDLVPANSSKSRKWTNKHIETTNGMNMLCRGKGKGRGINIKNKRPTKVILDDVEDDDQVKSKEGREKLHNWLFQVVYPSVDRKRGRIKMIGTVLSRHAEVLSFFHNFGGIKRKIIENGKSIWPEMYSLASIYKIKKDIGSRKFAQEYMNQPINEELSIIKQGWIGRFSTLNPVGLRKILMLDPQAGSSKSADTFGLSVIGKYRNDNKRYVLSCRKGRATQIEQAVLFIKTWQEDRLAFDLCGIEKVMAQVAVYQIVLDWKSGRLKLKDYGVDDNERNIPLIAVEPEGKDKTARLQIHEPAFERQEILFHSSLDWLVEDFCSFPDVDNDDSIDSVVYGLDYSYKTGATLLKQSETKPADRAVTAGLLNKTF